jgi:hypothetical protein
MLSNLGAGPVVDGLGLFHAIGSYCGEFSIAVTSCRDMMPDPEFYHQCLQHSFDALHAATVGADAAVAQTPGKKSSARRPSTSKARSAPKAKTRAKAKPKRTAGSK